MQATLNGKYDKSELAAFLRRAGMLRWPRLLCSLLTEDLGLGPACCLDGFRPCDAGPLRCIVRAGGISAKRHRFAGVR